MRTLVIMNPHGGAVKDPSRVAARIRDHRALDDPEIRITGERGDGVLLASAGVRGGFERIVAAGGDGTLNEVLNGVLGGNPPEDPSVVLAVLPLGTGNDFARSIGLPLDLDDALDALERARPRATDVVRVGGSIDRHFINASAGGFSGEVDQRVTEERKKSWGPLAYLRGALDVVRRPRSWDVTFTVDDGESRDLEAVNVVVANGRTAAGGVRVAPDARLDDGEIELVVVRAAGVGEFAALAPLFLLGHHLDHELVEHVRARRIRLRSVPAMPFNLDGELLTETPLDYSVLPGAVRVLVPASGAPAYGDDDPDEDR